MTKEYKPDGKCGTCRHMHVTTGGGFHEPPYCDAACGVEDELIQIRDILQGVADASNDEDAYGVDPIEGCGDTKTCPLYLPLKNCEKHGKLETGEFGCPTCDDEAYEGWAQDYVDEEKAAAEWRRANGLR